MTNEQRQQWAYQQQMRAAIQAAQHEQQAQRVATARQAAQVQQMIDEMPRRQYAIIVAVDIQGGFAKAGEIPWHYPADFRWFKGRTKNQVVVMGRVTYEDIVKRRGEFTGNVLSDRKCFVVSNTLTELPHATVVKSVGDVEHHLDNTDEDKTIFLIGGERVFAEGLSIADTAYVTVVNAEHSCDRFFPTDFLMEHFDSDKVYKHDGSPELRFTIWKRKI
ncbi:dihydrofolate reductase [Candidatus Thorarchaeota archaeon]|nr:MAG: dihydrofolate reductase [Candidatus Thorarchaeota archaeon]